MSERNVAQEIQDEIRLNQILEDADKVRKAGLYNTTVDGRDIISGGESDRDEKKYRHDYSESNKNKNFDEKIYMFPESYNALRRELSQYWPTLWQAVQWKMAHRAEEFVEDMNAALDVAVVFDTEKVDFISKTYLEKLQKMRLSGGF